MKKKKIPLLGYILIAIVLGILLGNWMPEVIVRLFVTFNALFSQFLSFCIPIIILGLVTVAIADIGRNAGKMLLVTVLMAYGMTVFSGMLSYLVSSLSFPHLIDKSISMENIATSHIIIPFFEVSIPPFMDVMTALVFAFVLGLGITHIEGTSLKNGANEFQNVVVLTIKSVIIPMLPIYIMGIFMNMTASGQVYTVLMTFVKVIGVIFILHIAILCIQYFLAGIISRQNPFRLLKRMLPAYFTALGTQSSAATIPVTLEQTLKNGVSPQVAGFVVPLCATIHLSGSTLKIVACAVALMIMQDMPFDFNLFSGFIFMLGIMMVAAPGVPGGAIMASLGILQSMLGFDQDTQALMIALYIAMDSFGTACNVTGDGALAIIINQIQFGKK